MDRRSRSRLLYAAVLAFGLLLLGAGWYFAGTPGLASNGRYVEGVVGAPEHPTPLFARGNAVDGDLARLLFSGLTRLDADGTPLPDLAESWEITPDGRTYTFHLRGGLTWHDGEPLTSGDVAFTVRAVQSPGFQGASGLAARWAGVETLTPDERTVVFRLPAASAPFLALASLGIVPRHLLDGLGPAELLDAPNTRATIGSGPFKLARLDATRALLEPNPRYHLGAPALESIELRFYPDAAALTRAIGSGEVDGALLDARPAPETLGAVVRRPGLHAVPLTEASYSILYINNQRGILTDPALRRALAASIDRASLIPEDSPALAGDGPIVPGTWAYQPGSWNTRAQADALFIAAGWPRGASGVRERIATPLKLELLTNDEAERTQLAASIAQQLRDQGVQVTVRALPPNELLQQHINPREFDLLLFGWQTDLDPDPYGGWHTSQIASGGRNVAGFHDADADKALEAGRTTLDTAERRTLYATFLQRFTDQAGSVVIQYPRRLYVQPRDLRDAKPSVLFDPSSRFLDVHRWRLGN